MGAQRLRSRAGKGDVVGAERSGHKVKYVVEHDLAGIVDADEQLLARVPVAGFHASEQNASGVSEVVLTDRRYLALAQRGMLKKRTELVAAWPHQRFTERINTSEGSALGPYLHLLTLFTTGDETVSAGFRSSSECERFKIAAANAVSAANGWT